MRERVITFFMWENMYRMGEKMSYFQKQNGDNNIQNKMKSKRQMKGTIKVESSGEMKS